MGENGEPARDDAARAVADLHRASEPISAWDDLSADDQASFYEVVDTVLRHIDGRTWEIARTLGEELDRATLRFERAMEVLRITANEGRNFAPAADDTQASLLEQFALHVYALLDPSLTEHSGRDA